MLAALQQRLGTPQVLTAVAFLLAGGLVMVYSASAIRAELLFGSSALYFWRQLGGLVLGVGAAAFLARVPLDTLRRTGVAFWILATLLVAATLTPLGLSTNGARRWLALGPLVFQPLELTKLAVVLATAQWLAARTSRLGDVRVSLLAPFGFAALPAALLLMQPDFGGALMLFLFVGVLVFTAGARLDHLAAAAAVTLPVVGVLALAPYRWARFEAFLDPWSDPIGRGYQLIQSMLAFGAGGLTGTGLGAGQQKLGYLPEAHTDFILSVVGEEVGLVGVLAVLAGFCLLALGALSIAARGKDAYALLLATGASLLIWLQAGVNAGVALGVLPTTGATLPLFSYGRTSLVVSLAAVGLILNAARPKRRGRSGWRA